MSETKTFVKVEDYDPTLVDDFGRTMDEKYLLSIIEATKSPTLGDEDRLRYLKLLLLDYAKAASAKGVARQYPYGGHTTQRAGRADHPIVAGTVNSAGLLLYAYVYEARWAGLKTMELSPLWMNLPESEREMWEQRAREISELSK